MLVAWTDPLSVNLKLNLDVYRTKERQMQCVYLPYSSLNQSLVCVLHVHCSQTRRYSITQHSMKRDTHDCCTIIEMWLADHNPDQQSSLWIVQLGWRAHESAWRYELGHRPVVWRLREVAPWWEVQEQRSPLEWASGQDPIPIHE